MGGIGVFDLPVTATDPNVAAFQGYLDAANAAIASSDYVGAYQLVTQAQIQLLGIPDFTLGEASLRWKQDAMATCGVLISRLSQWQAIEQSESPLQFTEVVRPRMHYSGQCDSIAGGSSGIF